MRPRDEFLRALRFAWMLLLAPLFASCSLTKDGALDRTRNLPTYRLVGNQTRYTSVTDWDGLPTLFHYFSKTNPNAGLTFVFIHGYPASLFTWTDILTQTNAVSHPNAAMLANTNANLLALDLPGHAYTKSNRSASQVRPLLPPAAAGQSVVRFLDAMGVKGDVVFVGHSFGALVSLYAAREAQAAELDHPAERRWWTSALVLVDPEGAPRGPLDYHASEQQLREGFDGFASRWHWMARWFGWTGRLNRWSFLIAHGYWETEAEEGLREVNASHLRKDFKVPPDQRKAYAWLMRVPENYFSNRELVRRKVPGEDDILNWGGRSLESDAPRRIEQRVLIWGEADSHFPYWRDGAFFREHFKPTSIRLIADAGHVATEDKPDEVAGVLLKLIPAAIRRQTKS